MNVLRLKKMLIGAVLGASLGAASAQTTTFTDSYSGVGYYGSTCNTSWNISGVEPSTPGKYPVFIYTVGTTETYNNASAMAAVNSMAQKGYVAAAVGYYTGQFGDCPTIKGKAACIFNPNSASSAISKICSRPNADCSKGIVTAGFSQGSIIAISAKEYDSRVQAAYGIGVSNHYATYQMDSCMKNGNHVLPSDRIRAVNGEGDQYAGTSGGYGTGTHAATQAALTAVTGLTCPSGSTSCLNSNGSGWIVVKNNQVQDGSADHCYMRASGDCSGSEGGLDSGWNSGTANWALAENLTWLTGFTNGGGSATTTTATTTATTTTTTMAGACYTASNVSHVLAGRAHANGTWTQALANGSNQNMGAYNAITTTKLRKTGANYYVIDSTCP